MKSERVLQLEAEIAELKRSFPAHSLPPALLMALEALEDALMAELEKEAGEKKDA